MSDTNTQAKPTTETPEAANLVKCSSPAQIYKAMGGKSMKHLFVTRKLVTDAKEADTGNQGVIDALATMGIEVYKESKDGKDESSNVISALRTYWFQRTKDEDKVKPSAIDQLRKQTAKTIETLKAAVASCEDETKLSTLQGQLDQMEGVAEIIVVKKDGDDETYDHIFPTLGRSKSSITVDLTDLDDISDLLG